MLPNLRFSVIVVSIILSWSCDKSSEKSSVVNERPAISENMFDIFNESTMIKYKPKQKGKKLKTFQDFIVAAEEAHSQRAYPQAAEFAGSALALNDKSGKAHYLRGKNLCASGTGDDDEALKEMIRAQELGFENGDLYEYMSKIYDGKNDYKHAIEALTNAIRTEPGSRDHYRYRGALYDLIGEHEKAERDYKVNIDMAYEKSGAYMDRGLMYEGNQRYQKALSDYTRAIELESRDTDELRSRYRLLLKLARDDEALKDLSEIVERNPNDDDSVHLRGDLYVRRKDYSAALRDYSKVIRNSPDQALHTYEARASLYDKLGDKDKAEADREMASTIRERPAEKTLFKVKR